MVPARKFLLSLALAAISSALPNPSAGVNDTIDFAHPPHCQTGTSLVGDGNPSQDFYNTQVTDNLVCDGESTYSISHFNSKAIRWTASADVNVTEWLSGGFDVQEAYETGSQYYQCDGNPGETICVWMNVAHTTYTVQNWQQDCDGPDGPVGKPYIIWSPNTDNVGGGPYCVTGSCRGINASSWIYNGRGGYS
ncbi:hypothetical protein VTN77DRAFT_7753 [Rasamsonia byssochlamydoides]|uniref:uncharacterized protein n=1 Tax=Rasamsonia byssochlamydoides TaxID=89139 RepID=UPI003742F8FB